MKETGALCTMGHPSETHLKLKSHEDLFTHNLFRNGPIVLKVCAGYDSDTAMLCAKFKNILTTDMDVMDQWDFVRFQFNMNFGDILYCAAPQESYLMWWCID